MSDLPAKLPATSCIYFDINSFFILLCSHDFLTHNRNSHIRENKYLYLVYLCKIKIVKIIKIGIIQFINVYKPQYR